MKMLWREIDKGDPRGRILADGHYTRQTVGHPMWTRPGWNQCLYYEQRNGRSAVFAWFRPKWESGIVGTERKDKLRAIECAIFRNCTRVRSSELIEQAVAAVLTWEHALDVDWPDGLITGVSSEKTAGGRHEDHAPGWCFREAGWDDFEHAKGRADVWLRCNLIHPAQAIVPVDLGRRPFYEDAPRLPTSPTNQLRLFG